MHESRWLWAIHVVHHSSEHYNLSTALRQPVADVFGMFVPYGALSLLGLRPAVIETGPRRQPALPVLDPHRDDPRSSVRSRRCSTRRRTTGCTTAATGSYLDRNHGSILIIWDRLFGTFEREDDDEPVVYGLTKNIDTFDPVRVATHEHVDILRDVARSRTWRERLGYVLRAPAGQAGRMK